MLLGTTYAYFVDGIKISSNVIQGGKLDILLEYKTNWGDEWSPVEESTKLFRDSALYEPGYTEVVYLRVSNAGTLALKYLLSLNIASDESSINVYGDEFKLSEYLKVGTYVVEESNSTDALISAKFGDNESALESVELHTLKTADPKICSDVVLLPKEDTAYIVAIVLTMPEDGAHKANTKLGENLPYIDLGVRLFATQYTYESDSFDNMYDDSADSNDTFVIRNDSDLDKAFQHGGEGFIVEKVIPDVNAQLGEGKDLVLNMNNSTLSIGDESDYIIVNRGDLELTGDGLLQSNMNGAVENWGNLLVNNLNIEVKGVKYGFHCKDGEVEINNINLLAERGGLNVQGGKLIMNSGLVQFKGYYDNDAKKWNNGYAVYAVGKDTEVVINGGDFRFTGANGRQRILCAQDGAKIIVNGGTFGKGASGVSSTWLWEYDSNTANDIPAGDIIIYGGSFEFDPSEFVAVGYQAVKGTDGWWTVSKIGN
jgi:hypothetical protein